jgi:transcriptional regulator with XRE-family HTH domain
LTQEHLASVEEQLRAALEQTGLSHHELARRSGVSQPILSRFIRGERTLTLPIVNKLCEMLGLKLCPGEASKPAQDLEPPTPAKGKAGRPGGQEAKGEGMTAVPPNPGRRRRRAASKRQGRWTEEELALLGTIPDEEVAAQTGRTKMAVYFKRRELGIAQCLPTGSPGPRWSKEEIALLGTAPDEEIARQTGRTKRSVSQKRWLLGIANPCDRRRQEHKA